MVPTPIFLPRKSHRGIWWTIVHGAAKSQTRLSDWAPAMLVRPDWGFSCQDLCLIVTLDTFCDLPALYSVHIVVIFPRWLSIMTACHLRSLTSRGTLKVIHSESVNQEAWQWTWSLESYHRLSLIDWKSGSGWGEYKVERAVPVPNLGI